jgi:GYF domain 2
MADRSWFFASQGQQQGPYPEAQLREFIAKGMIGADTLVWTEGMANWQKAADIPGLLSGASGPPAMPQRGGALTSTGHGGQFSIEVGLWSLLGWCLLFSIGILLVIPAPWAATGFYRWLASRIEVPGRSNIAFTGQPGDIWYVFVAMGLLSYAGTSGSSTFELVAMVAQAALSWMNVRWIASNLSPNGEKLPITFNGSAWGYIGWYVLMYVSVITIIGWAWVITAWMRWICRNISGTRREIVFNATGLELLWRTLLFAIGCALLIPIPWVLRWYARWYVSQFALVERSAHAQA